MDLSDINSKEGMYFKKILNTVSYKQFQNEIIYFDIC